MSALELTAAILAAAGRGRRLGTVPKALLPFAGRTLLEHTLAAVLEPDEIHAGVVVVPGEHLAAARELAVRHPKVTAVLPGGEERQDSVAAGLAAVGDAVWVVVHDAARPLVSAGLVRRVLEAARETGAATAALPARDTVKLVGAGMVTETLDRERIWLAQTPQAFRRALLRDAHERARREGLRATDDATLVEAVGAPVRVVPGDPLNFKVTTAEDLALAEVLVRERAGAGERRTGIGYDVHRLVPGRRLILGGVEIPSALGLAGHSDADAVLHAVMDALLGAAGLPDIGQLFPPTDERFRGADSSGLLRAVVNHLRQVGYAPVNIDVVILAEAPLLAPYIPAMRERLAGVLAVEAGDVGLKATTAEGLGAIGRGEGIAAQAVATVRRITG